ncbi:Tat (twin-arginine translocation) pathway signal sequence [Actinacidiphila yanglinensis]|uniref:Tat (Twin-arginine translocation) pathway signal sequence n=1 Tax=Actinacidiphila yanglinensis TaxID=310779 RepID=A0A1H6C610_9ACTN|nr:molybdopterin cofactor-binding domain-containing protein [Actinacidiphila yanglinensis]SEG68420.1 Tat (twin-arginine translocation) pathway signal sequence [Actinacidiphila yanglinensis]
MTTVAKPSRRQFLAGAGVLAVAFTVGNGVAHAGTPDGIVRIDDSAGEPDQSWLVLTEDAITVYSGKVELGTGIQTSLTQIVVEELRLRVADVRYVQGDTLLSVSQGGTTGSKSIQNGGVQLRQAAATAFAELRRRAAAALRVDARELHAADGVFRARGRSVGYGRLLRTGSSVLPLDTAAPVLAPRDYRVVGTSQPRVDLPGKLDATFAFLHDIAPPGTLHGRVIRPPGRNAHSPVIGDLDRAQAVDGFVTLVRHDRFIGVVAATEWAAARAASPSTGITVTWSDGPAMIPQAELPTALRDPENQYATVVEIDDGVDPLFAAAGTVLTAQYFTPFHMHATMGASTAVADVRSQPDPDTGIQATVWSGTQNVTALRGALAGLLGLQPTAVRVIYEEASGCYGHDGVDDCAADAALLSQAAGAPVRVQWTRQDEHGWEPYGGAQAHDMKGALGTHGITAWSHLNYAPTANSRPSAGNPGTLLAGALTGLLPDPLPASSVDTSGRNAPLTYAIPQRVEARLIKSFETIGPASPAPAAPLTYRIPRTTALRSLGGFSNSFANESFFDELAHAGGHDPLRLRIDSLPDPRAVDVCRALLPAWNRRPKGGDGVGAGVAFHQYEVVNAYVATYVEVHVDAATGAVRVDRVVVAHDCGLVINPDGLRNQIEGNVVQGISRTLKEEVHYTGDAVTSLVWQSATPGAAYDVIRFNEVPSIETILLDRPDQPAWGAGEPTIGTIGGAVANAVFAATGVRVRTLPITPDKLQGGTA